MSQRKNQPREQNEKKSMIGIKLGWVKFKKRLKFDISIFFCSVDYNQRFESYGNIKTCSNALQSIFGMFKANGI